MFILDYISQLLGPENLKQILRSRTADTDSLEISSWWVSAVRMFSPSASSHRLDFVHNAVGKNKI